ncbi:tetratricopeptide repeat protein [Sphingomonas sp. JC676]|uniref:SPOR domain-containing protein n=1 Tax=Sphingomonas sp. JC676 TaxID=2768065 RepID=UPI00223BF9B7|nr:tetratricopeptide repeat protein [Sphingomonas sp. JC676]
MNARIMLSIGAAVFAVGGTAVTGIVTQGHAFATSAPNAKKAASEADAARKAIAKRKADKAVQHAELAVANDPQNAEYRSILGQAYLLSGRFTSAGQALNDSLTLNPEDGRVALNLVLAKIAQGDWAGARSTLQTHADHIPSSDRGLAFALAGDPVTAVEILTPAVREPTANAKTRQNLALSLALAGRWSEARAVAATDVSPDQLDARIMQWASFSRPTNAYDQVASLLGVRAVQDGGQPIALALAQQPNVAVAATAPAPAPAADPVDAYMPGPAAAAPAVADAAPAPVAPVAAPDAAPVVQQVAVTGPQVVFGPSAEVVQAFSVSAKPAPAPVRVASVKPAAKPVTKAATPSAKLVSGNYYVQLGAFDSAAVAKDSWARVARRLPKLSGYAPQGAKFSTKAGNFYRLSVGGFARSDANSLCRQVRAGGGVCFVRAQAGDAVASWASKREMQMASR